MTILKRLAGKATQAVTKKTTTKVVAEKAAKTVTRDVVNTSAREVAAKTAKKAAEQGVNPGFSAAMSAVRERLSKEGKYANVSKPLMDALGFATTAEESLQVASLARKLSTQFNQANRGALLHALEDAAKKSKVPEETFTTLAQVVRTRQEAYALFSLAEKNKIVETAVDRYMTVGGESGEELARKAIRLVKARFDQRSANSTIKRVGLMEKVEDQVRTIANFINKALS